MDITADTSILEALKASGAHGIGSDLENACDGLSGKWILSKLIEDSELDVLQAYYPLLHIYNAQYTLIMFDDEESNDGNITNLDNGSSDGDPYGYQPSGHISRLQSLLHVYRGQWMEDTNKMRLKQVSDEDLRLFKDGTPCDPTDNAGTGYDFFLGLPHYWYKGINDHVNQRK